MRALLLASCPILLLACAGKPIDDDDLPAEAAPVICDRLRDCARGYYEGEFSDHGDCLDEVTEALEDMTAALNQDPLCDYDEEDAGEWVNEQRGMSCEEWWDQYFDESTNA